MRGPGAGPGAPPCGVSSAPEASRSAGGDCEYFGFSSPEMTERSVIDGPPLLAITLPDWGVPPGSPVPIPWAKWRGRHGEVLDTDVPDDCPSDGGVMGIETCGSSITGGTSPFAVGVSQALARSSTPGGLLSTRPLRRSMRPGWLEAISWTSSVSRATVMGGRRTG